MMDVNPTEKILFKKFQNHWMMEKTDRKNAQIFSRINHASSRNVQSTDQPVLFFNASARLTRTSLNAAFAWLTANSLQNSGIPVTFFVCMSGLKPCLLAAQRDNLSAELPCNQCMRLSKKMYQGLNTVPLTFLPDNNLSNEVEGLDLEALESFVYQNVPLGELTLPSLRWIMRRHHLAGVRNAVQLHRRFICSAWSIYRQVQNWISANNPRAIVVFNGLQYPEAVVKWLGKQLNIPTFTHEIGLMPFTAIFTEGEATACPIELPADFEMTPERNARLDTYLSNRMQGKFTTAGIQFWPQMESLTPEFWNLARTFRQIVPVFTNVIFDTSQKHANVVFSDMFHWLDEVKTLIAQHSDTLFVIRAHPDEIRPGKESLETVTDWVVRNRVNLLPNVLYVGPDQYFSSYELIQNAKFVLVYNSTIGLEAAIMGAAVISGGRSRYTQVPITYFPQSVEEFHQWVQKMLVEDDWHVPPEFQQTARKFLYYQFFHTALSFGEFIQPDPIWNGYVALKSFSNDDLNSSRNTNLKIIEEGIRDQKPFVIPHE